MNNAIASNLLEFPLAAAPNLRAAAKVTVSSYRTKKQHRSATQHLLADLRGRVASTRRVMEDSEVEQILLRPLYEHMIRQLQLLDELERQL